MHTILFLLPDLSCHGYAKQAALLARTLPRDQFAVHVAVLQAGGVFSERLEQAGLSIHVLRGSRTWFHVPIALHRLLRALAPDLVQAWDGAAPWAALARFAMFRRHRWPLVVVEPGLEGISVIQAARIVIHAPHGAGKVRHPRVKIVPPAVEVNPTPLQRQALLRECGLPDDARFVLCAGAIEKGHGFREAVWIFDILKHVYPNLWLLISGEGPERRSVEAFGLSRGQRDNRVKILGARSDIPQLVGQADLAWVCGRQGGRNFVLEALAAGCPVVTPRLPKFVELLGDDETGFLVATEAASGFAQASRRILDDPVLSSALRQSGRARAARFDSARVVNQWLDLYAELISPAGCNSSSLLSP
jgi:glycosyltransferase involved in cell wall biosynthesis